MAVVNRVGVSCQLGGGWAYAAVDLEGPDERGVVQCRFVRQPYLLDSTGRRRVDPPPEILELAREALRAETDRVLGIGGEHV